MVPPGLRLNEAQLMVYSETSNNRLSEKRTTSVQWTSSMTPIALPIEIVHLELREVDTSLLRIMDSQHAPKGQQSIQNNLREQTANFGHLLLR